MFVCLFIACLFPFLEASRDKHLTCCSPLSSGCGTKSAGITYLPGAKGHSAECSAHKASLDSFPQPWVCSSVPAFRCEATLIRKHWEPRPSSEDADQLVKCLARMHDGQGWTPALHSPAGSAHACNPRSQEEEAGDQKLKVILIYHTESSRSNWDV